MTGGATGLLRANGEIKDRELRRALITVNQEFFLELKYMTLGALKVKPQRMGQLLSHRHRHPLGPRQRVLMDAGKRVQMARAATREQLLRRLRQVGEGRSR